MTTTLTPQKKNEVTSAEDRAYVRPHYDIRPDKENYEMRVLMPGVAKDGVQISLDRDVLTIEGKRAGFNRENWRPIMQELDWHDYRLRVELNVDIDEEQIRAHVEDGVLSLSLPKAEEAKPRRIEVS